MTRTRWLWLPGEDGENGGVAVADPGDLPFDILQEDPAAPALRAVSG